MQLVDRVVDVLTLLSNNPSGIGVSDIAKNLDISVGSVHRILSSLKKHYYVYQSEDSKNYYLGYGILSLSQKITDNDNRQMILKPYLYEISKKINETVALYVFHNERLICIDYIESDSFMQLMVRKNVEMPTLVTSAGKLFVSILSDEKLKDIYIVEKEKYNYTMSLEEVISEIESVRTKGYGVSDEELQTGVHSVAFPIRDYSSDIKYAVSVTSLKNHNILTPDIIDFIGEISLNMSKALGYVLQD